MGFSAAGAEAGSASSECGWLAAGKEYGTSIARKPGVMARKVMRTLTEEGSKRVLGGHRHSSGASL